MNCPHCNKIIPDGSFFCPECNKKIDSSTIPDTNATIENENPNASQSVDEPITKNDTTASTSYFNSSPNTPTTPYTPETNHTVPDEQAIYKFKKGKLSKVIIVFAIICLIFGVTAFSGGNLIGGLIALLQTILFVCAWLMGMGTIKSPAKNLHLALALVAFLLIIPAIAILGKNGISTKKSEPLTWPSTGLAKMLPKPESKYGNIMIDAEEHLYVTVDKYSDELYNNYLSKCIELGYTIDSKKATYTYEAYNSDGYKLQLSHFGEDQMNIDLEAPLSLSEIDWDDIDAFKLLPTPKSTTGKIEWEQSDSAYVYISDTSTDDFKAYIKACKKAGFKDDARKGDDYYYADYKKKKRRLSLNYQGFNTMTIRIDVIEDDEDDTTDNTDDKKSSDTSKESSSDSSKEEKKKDDKKKDDKKETTSVKKAMDEYEEFIDEYIDFMKTYSESESTAELLSEYVEYMQKYSDAMEAIDAMDTDNMSASDKAYYIEVTTRCSQKLIDAAINMQ